MTPFVTGMRRGPTMRRNRRDRARERERERREEESEGRWHTRLRRGREAKEERGWRERYYCWLKFFVAWVDSAACTSRLRDQFTFPSWQYASPPRPFFRLSRSPAAYPTLNAVRPRERFLLEFSNRSYTRTTSFFDKQILIFFCFYYFKFFNFFYGYCESIFEEWFWIGMLWSIGSWFISAISFLFIISSWIPRKLCPKALETFENDEL